MAFAARTRLINPRLGTYFAIFTSAFVAIALVALMLEQLAVSDATIRWIVLAAPVLLYGAIALAAATRQAPDFFVAGRRIPPFFNGLVLAVTALGGIGFITLPGVLFMIGVDGFAFTLGWVAGLVFAGVLLVPFLRRFGSFTLPSYLGQRFESKLKRL